MIFNALKEIMTLGFNDAFPSVDIIGCLFHFKKAIYEHAKKLGLTKKRYANLTSEVIQGLSSLCWLDTHLVNDKFDALHTYYVEEFTNLLNKDCTDEESKEEEKINNIITPIR